MKFDTYLFVRTILLVTAIGVGLSAYFLLLTSNGAQSPLRALPWGIVAIVAAALFASVKRP